MEHNNDANADLSSSFLTSDGQYIVQSDGDGELVYRTYEWNLEAALFAYDWSKDTIII